MSLHEEMRLFTELSGEDGAHTSIARIGGYLDGYERGKADSKWIPCSERLPNNESLVLVYYIFNEQIEDKKDIWIGWHEMDGVWYVDGEEHGEEWNNEVIAWMPLPEPYKEEEEW